MTAHVRHVRSICPIKVLHSFPVWLPQTQTWMFHQIMGLPAEEVEAHIACEVVEHLDQFNVPRIHCLTAEPGLKARMDYAMRRLGLRRHLGYSVRVGRRIRAQIVHSHFGNVGWNDLGLAKRLEAKHVVSFYGFDVRQLPASSPVWEARLRSLFSRVDRVLCEGPAMAAAIADLGCPNRKIVVQHLGIDVESIAFRPRSRKQDEPLRILVSASFREKKGIPFAIEAVAALAGMTKVELTVIGDSNGDEHSRQEKESILNTVARTGMSEKVRFLGYQPYARLFEEAYAHHVFLAPSVVADDGDCEGGAPLTLIEMAATGMPVVSSIHCDIPEMVEAGRSGLLVPERDVPGLTQALVWLVEHPEAWGDMARAARDHAEREYSMYRQGRRLAEIYRGVLDESR